MFNFNAEHNGVQCIESSKPEDRGTEHQYWFTRQMLAENFDVGRDTVTRHVDFLIGRGVLTVAQNCVTVQLVNAAGAINNTTLYDLKVFNLLVMRLKFAPHLKCLILYKHNRGALTAPSFLYSSPSRNTD